jgi:hypothetical protein
MYFFHPCNEYKNSKSYSIAPTDSMKFSLRLDFGYPDIMMKNGFGECAGKFSGKSHKIGCEKKKIILMGNR